MHKWALAVAYLFTVLVSAFAQAPPEQRGNWVGRIVTDGTVTVVENTTGSVWGGRALLVEETSIGTERGHDSYLFGTIQAIALTQDRVYVLDSYVGVVRVYGLSGEHLYDFGRAGQGPGEFSFATSLAVTGDGRVLVRDDGNSRITVFSANGDVLDTWPLGTGFGSSIPLVIANDGAIYTPVPVSSGSIRNLGSVGYVEVGANGPVGAPIQVPELDFEPPRLRSGSSSGSVPYNPEAVMALSPAGAVIFGIGDRYEFRIRRFDGTELRILRLVAPVRMTRTEIAWHERAATAVRRAHDPNWSWNGPPIPNHKPFFDTFYADSSGRIWVRRLGPSTQVSECDVHPTRGPTLRRCWEDTFEFDVFANDGRYLGALDAPEGIVRYAPPQQICVRDDMVAMAIEDDAGTAMVKIFRLVVPR